MNNFKETFQQQAIESEGLTQQEETICKNLRFGLAIALSMIIFLYVAEQIFCS